MESSPSRGLEPTRDRVALRALTLHERLDLIEQTEAPSASPPGGQRELDTRLQRWTLVVAKGDEAAFERRLAWDELALDDVRRALAFVPERLDPTPDWLKTIRRIEHQARRVEATTGGRSPFEALLRPMLVTAWEALFRALDDDKDRAVALVRELTSPDACLDLERGLAESLLRLCDGPLHEAHSASEVDADAFVREQLSAGLGPLFDEYPVLARLVATRIEYWANATRELLLRFHADREALARGLRPGPLEAPERILRLRSSLSDPHHHGRSVLTLELADDLRVVYKPRSLALEAAYYQLLRWCNETGELLALRTVEVLDRGDYGWMEYVRHEPCADEAAARRFYERAGIVLCLLYVLGTNDCHEENLIASGEHLLLIDAETTMHAEARQPDDERLDEPAALAMSSVLRVGLLPRWEYRKGQGIHDVSGLGGGQSSSVHDDDDPTASSVGTPRFGNVPRIGDNPVSPNDHVEELVRGFEGAYRLLLRQRASLLDPAGPLAPFRGPPVRFVHRNTRIYGTILRHSLQPRFLRDAVSRSIELEILGRAYLVARDDAGPLLFDGERRALERLDIPYFWTDPEGTLFIDDVPVRADAFEPCLDRVLDRIRALDEADLRVQGGMIRGALFARIARGDTPGSSSADATRGPSPDEMRPFTRDAAIAAASRIAEELRAQAIEIPGGATWVGLLAEPSSSRIRFEMVGDDLYNGRGGIALFLAGLHRVSGDDAARELALRALAPIRRRLVQTSPAALETFAKQLGLGAIVGVGSLVYGLVKAAGLLARPELLDDAERAFALITPELIEHDRLLDVTHGAAGALLAGLAMHAAGREDALPTARLCAEHLIRRAESGADDSLRWVTLPDRPALTGFAHGAAGIVMALLRLYEVTGEERYGRAARAGLRFEHELYVPEADNWPDLRSVRASQGDAAFMHGWCTGPAGIGLGRLRGLAVEPSTPAEEDLTAALRGTLRRCWGPRDDLCCGVLGRVELLVEAGRRRSRPDLSAAAQTHAATVVARAERTGRYSLFDELPDGVYNPGLFRGTAGIGYGLLRVAFPDVLPSVLSLD